MFQFLYIFAPAAVTYLTVEKLLKKEQKNYFHAFLELLVYAGLDVMAMILLLVPSGKVELIILSSGLRTIQYGRTAYVLAFVIALILGLAIAVIRKRVEIALEISPSDRKQKNT